MRKKVIGAQRTRTLPIKWLGDGEKLEIVTHSPADTQKFGEALARDLPCPCIVLLEGELGAGKTTLVKGIVQGLGEAREEEVTSPSFALVHEYGSGGRVYHIDLYRIGSAPELATLGLDDIFARQSIVLVEWGEKLGEKFVNPAVRIRMEYAGEKDRRITVERAGAAA
jgi:tRNA threonylcarbamoyladenosine biosynthesis protein TsaE